MKPIRITLADDHPLVLAGMKALLEPVQDISIVGEATDGKNAIDVIGRERPDIAVLDISLPIIGGIELAQRIAIEYPNVRLLALTVHEDRAYVQPMLQAGARGYLLKRSAADELVRAIRAIAEGGIYLDPAIAEKALPSPPGDHAPSESATQQELTPREAEVLRLVAQGFSNKEIAARLDVSIKTIETHKSRAVEKLGLHKRADIVRYGVSQGWLDHLSK
ncbi:MULTISPECIES: response regulator [unclassified Bradyrhizobium]|uniref:response regulator n=1 Tax=unclassified Bradyrhizobium TaxID=2631580 RepID=UPI00211EAF0E|nr:MULTISPECIES: response regulator transcription factor [unclassified Bradyrhizobium]MDD1534161.1 DNA-binding response regulator [Bradyrhizobium sp. WBOS8]MDD1583882.1 DNA-binding response regulator [Bradyrhizobium sp. WBOS4]UUO46870.1 DNA-binding response regulator [Bradyrhizobium sp. WBOS04]UUO60489.1 DNA-binding response regulator [Bradyrhizobium sp. WBOS08]